MRPILSLDIGGRGRLVVSAEQRGDAGAGDERRAERSNLTFALLAHQLHQMPRFVDEE
jgi:hypothetical protein